MEFFYTGADFFNGVQQNIEKSVGGYLSSSKVPNNSLSNIFSDISQLGKRRGFTECKAIVLKNTTGATKTNIYLYHTYPDGVLSKIEWAAVTLTANQKMEKIPNFRSSPYVGTFYEPVNVGGKILLTSSLVDGGVIGLWVKRTIILPDLMDAIEPKDLDVYIKALTKREDIVVTLEYT